MPKLGSEIKGLLIDLDGVLYVGNEIIDGAVEMVKYLRDRDIPFRFVTNTTTKSLDRLHHKINDLGLPAEKHEIISAPRAAVLHLRNLGQPVCHLCMNDDVKRDFSEFEISDTDPDVLVIGDIDDRWDYEIMNRLFRLAVGRADIVALHKGKYWQETEGLRLDIGAFVAGLEYATGKEAAIVGKPNPAFFRLAIEDMGLTPENTIMIGDDIDMDIGGAHESGVKGILVRTGKYRKELADRSHVIPYCILDSISDLKELI